MSICKRIFVVGRVQLPGLVEMSDHEVVYLAGVGTASVFVEDPSAMVQIQPISWKKKEPSIIQPGIV